MNRLALPPQIRPTTLLLPFYALCSFLLFVNVSHGQTKRRLPRARPPEKLNQGQGIFFDDVRSTLRGELPSKKLATVAQGTTPGRLEPESAEAPDDPFAWKNIISASSLEDLVKGTKLRLDRVITSPTAFKSGGYQEARKEFGTLAMLFAIIETYPEEVRWKSSAALAREMLARTAANSKIGSRQVFDEAKKRMFDLGDLLRGSKLTGTAKSEIQWANLIDRVPLMQVLEWAHEDYVSKFSANESQFKENSDELRKYAEFIGALGKVAIAEDMPDASDDDYIAFAKEMVKQSQQVVLAVQTGNADLARKASGQIGQSCVSCHDNFR